MRPLFISLGLAFLSSWAALAGDLSANNLRITGGGGTSSGGNYQLTTTLGQPARLALGGGSFRLNTSISSLTVVQTPGAPLLDLKITGPSLVLSWALPATEYRLQMNGDLAQTNAWMPVLQTPVTNQGIVSVSLPPPTRNRFFRLHRAGP